MSDYGSDKANATSDEFSFQEVGSSQDVRALNFPVRPRCKAPPQTLFDKRADVAIQRPRFYNSSVCSKGRPRQRKRVSLKDRVRDLDLKSEGNSSFASSKLKYGDVEHFKAQRTASSTLFPTKGTVVSRGKTSRLGNLTRDLDVAGVKRYASVENVNTPFSVGFLPLTSATQRGWEYVDDKVKAAELEIVKILLERRADPTLLDPGGRSPLCNCYNLKVCRLLVSARADPLAKGCSTWPPMFGAAGDNELEILKFYVKELEIDPRTVTHEDETILHVATYRGHYDIIEWILQNTELGVDCVTSVTAKTPLYLAAKHGHIRILNLLLNENADPNLRKQENDLDHTPFTLACKVEENLEVVDAMLAKGADVNVLVATRSRASIGEESAKPGTLVQSNDNKDDSHVYILHKSPLTMACQRGSVQTVVRLLAANADPEGLPDENHTPLNASMRMRNLADAGVMLVLVRMLLGANANVNKQEMNGWIPLTKAAYYGYADVVAELLKHPEIDIDRADGQNAKAKQIAAKKEHAEILKMLCG